MASGRETEWLKIDMKEIGDWRDLLQRPASATALRKAAGIIKSSGTVAFPTETVYGLGADGLREDAVRRIFRAKGRPMDNPLILHLSSYQEMKRIVQRVPPQAETLGRAFWPGPLTLILTKNKNVPDLVTGGLTTVAFRIPDHPVALALIKLSGVPVAAPSANLSGRPSPTTGQHVWDDLRGRIDLILDAGLTGIGIESTVLDLTVSPPSVLRPGGLPREKIEKVLGNKVSLSSCEGTSCEEERGESPGETLGLKSPGMRYTHYSPRAKVILVEKGDMKKLEKVAREFMAKDVRTGLLLTGEHCEKMQRRFPGAVVRSLGPAGDVSSMGRRLFGLLREFDREGCEVVLAEGIEPTGLGMAIMNRLKKAADDIV